MSKFTFEEKQLAVKLYLQGTSSEKIIKELKVASHSQLLFWVKQYKEHGSSALREKRSHQEYPYEFKLEVLKWKNANNASYEATALHFGISSSSLVYKWNKQHEQGTLAVPARRGRPRKKDSIPPHQEELIQLRKQNQALLEELNRLKQAQKISGGEMINPTFLILPFKQEKIQELMRNH
ncbi:transposase [Lactobacillus sp. PV034]|uniref:transposase n=1 Tax=Lactobacillus sp. PV034 TaxID=2594495 RepID=UPI0022400DD3|nr:transposase [Lactobacillus sp. PV034]